MKKLLLALILTALATPAQATPGRADNGLMAYVPNFGFSRVETVNFCLGSVGVDKYQDLMTDSEFEGFESCMHENT